MSDRPIRAGMRVRHVPTDRVGHVILVSPRRRPPIARVLFDGDSGLDAVEIRLSDLVVEEPT